MLRRVAFLTLAGLAIAGPAPAVDPRPDPRPDGAAGAKPTVEVAICLDVSNSMDGLIGSAKQRLWDIVNDLAKAQPAPDLRVALYSYGNPDYPASAGWVRKELDLTTDLDEVYRKLTALRTHGGDEYVARVCRDALRDLKWTYRPNALKLIFVCGNEPASQDREVSLANVAEEAKRGGVVVNCIFCGDATDRDATDWKSFARMAGGRFASIDQEKGAVAVATPYDKELGDWSSKLNRTYVAYGKLGAAKAENQTLQDSNATAASPAANAARAVTKGGALYRNSDWDLVDRLKDDKEFDLAKVSEAELPEELRKLKPEERLPYLKGKLAEREAIQKKIADLSKQRETHIAALPKTERTMSLDAALRGMIRDQAAEKGIKIP